MKKIIWLFVVIISLFIFPISAWAEEACYYPYPDKPIIHCWDYDGSAAPVITLDSNIPDIWNVPTETEPNWASYATVFDSYDLEIYGSNPDLVIWYQAYPNDPNFQFYFYICYGAVDSHGKETIIRHLVHKTYIYVYEF